MHKLIPQEGNLVRVEVSGKLTQEDYDALIPAWEKIIQQEGSLRMLLLMDDFHGWEPKAAWDDFHFAVTHHSKVQRIAAVGERTWQKWLMKVGALFLPDEIKYFDAAQLAEAERWVRQS